MKLCLNMIVKNESAIIERCLASVAPYIDCYVIADTGSTDGTQDKIRAFFAEKGIPGEIVEFPFEDFSQSRNGALDAAEASSLEFDYLLLTDADMEFVVEDAGFKESLTCDGYMVRQIAGNNLEYDNARFMKRGCGARYKSPTHEYLSLPSQSGRLRGVWFKDHACGANRPNKSARDIALLEKGLENEPENPRYYFYLAQSYFEAGRFEDAMKAYDKRATMGSFEEEAWYAQMMSAQCSLRLGDESHFQSKILAAFNRRPHRSEPLFHLAGWYLQHGKAALAALIAEEGMKIPFPKDDILFVERMIYETGFVEIFSIAGYYTGSKRIRAFEANNWLSLSKRASARGRQTANANMQHFLNPLGTYLDSWKSQEIPFKPDEGWHALNPSVCLVGDKLLANIRTVNYKVAFTPKGAHYVTPDNAPITTRNFIVDMTEKDGCFSANARTEVLPPENWPEPIYKGIIGFEDLRLCRDSGSLYVNGTICELTPDGDRQMMRARLIYDTSVGRYRLSDWSVIKPEGLPVQPEKNWMPFSDIEKGFCYLYSLGPTRVVNGAGKTILEHEPDIVASGFRGGSQLVPFDGGWLAVVHEVTWHKGENRRIYYHRFVWLDKDFNLRRVSPPFVFNKVRFEFAAGLSWLPDRERLAVSYGVDDCEAHIGVFKASDLLEFLQPTSMLSGRQEIHATN